MQRNLLFLVVGLSFIMASCGNSQETVKEVVVTDTVVKTETVVVKAVVDSAAITAFYEAAHAKGPGTHQVVHKVHGKSKKMVRIDSHLPLEHHDVMTIVTPATESKPGAEPAVIVVHDVEKVYFRPDEKASFPGGEKAFDEFIQKNLQFPDDAITYGLKGTLFAVVSLDELGKVSKVDFVGKHVGISLEDETRRLLLASPRWNPAKHGGAPVKSKFTVPITFDIKS